mmetsp:Transcript_66876/g.193691  ORF Transcript_66876/g.193691 Transcript_66876/m.193691 type:complete len:85 (-) Transcript_66876:1699-1953(-)
MVGWHWQSARATPRHAEPNSLNTSVASCCRNIATDELYKYMQVLLHQLNLALVGQHTPVVDARPFTKRVDRNEFPTVFALGPRR